jgi:arginase family enzyme
MPLAALLGYGEARPIAAHAASTVVEGHVDPRNVALVGVRSYEPEEAELLGRLGVKVFDQAAVDAQGVRGALADAVRIARAAAGGYGISVDLDAVDPGDAPGVGTPVAGGVPGRELVAALGACCGDARFVALEIVEYNPHRDVGNRTARLVEEMIAAALALGDAPLPARL